MNKYRLILVTGPVETEDEFNEDEFENMEVYLGEANGTPNVKVVEFAHEYTEFSDYKYVNLKAHKDDYEELFCGYFSNASAAQEIGLMLARSKYPELSILNRIFVDPVSP